MFMLCFLREKTESIDAPIDKYYCVYGSVFDHTTNDYMVLRMVFGKLAMIGTRNVALITAFGALIRHVQLYLLLVITSSLSTSNCEIKLIILVLCVVAEEV
jgi:hypothetical protein